MKLNYVNPKTWYFVREPVRIPVWDSVEDSVYHYVYDPVYHYIHCSAQFRNQISQMIKYPKRKGNEIK
jgi:hypothetical protein